MGFVSTQKSPELETSASNVWQGIDAYILFICVAEEKSGVVLQNYVSVAKMLLHNKFIKRGTTMYLLYMLLTKIND